MPTVEHENALKSLNPRTVIDVGANKGQFSLVARKLFPEALIHAFEPLETERRRYEAVVRGPVKIHSVALGATQGVADFYLASRADSSSLFMPGEVSKGAYGVVLSSVTSVRVERLDEILESNALAGPVLLKLDVQGGELEVLRGAENILSLVEAIYCEVSFVELYEKQPSVGGIISFLERHKFFLKGIFNLSYTKSYGLTQADFLFRRQENMTTSVNSHDQ